MQLRLGMIGFGRVASSVMDALSDSHKIKVVSVGSRSLAKAQRIAEHYGIESYFGSYEELITSDIVEAVYIALPNSLHFFYCKLALENDKSVICEKPITVSSRQYLELRELADLKGLIIFEALMYQYTEPFRSVTNLLSQDAIGTVRFIDSAFNYSSKVIAQDDIRLNSELHGGVINDLLYYPVSLCNTIFSGQPISMPFVHKAPAEIERTAIASLVYSGDRQAKVQASFDLNDSDSLTIIGSLGSIEVPNAFRFREELEIIVTGKKNERYRLQKQPHRYLEQFNHFNELIYKKIKPLRSHDRVLMDIQTIETIRLSM